MKELQFSEFRQSLVHPARTTIAAALALMVARLLTLPEAYWAPISTLIVMQSTLGAALTISGQRLAGTALGCVAGALLMAGFGPSLPAYGGGVFALGLLCIALGLDRPGLPVCRRHPDRDHARGACRGGVAGGSTPVCRGFRGHRGRGRCDSDLAGCGGRSGGASGASVGRQQTMKRTKTSKFQPPTSREIPSIKLQICDLVSTMWLWL